ncbi:hypothetical protein AMEX_G25160 [Astyanax mexicanus]|uniref:Immunoglobulin domain-containing protein n=1 Tax=Astyanax mexicanus TaxID=7994 RepID=A0A8T2KX18_ASTMX|nr:hypothetical protein AMEX_G25160 [Astyanax mexicanus]
MDGCRTCRFSESMTKKPSFSQRFSTYKTVRWTVQNPFTVLAECNQTACGSAKEGFNLLQYEKGDMSLTISNVDFWKRNLYTCQCNGEDLCDVQLEIEDSHVPVVKVQFGDSAVLPCTERCSGVVRWTVFHKRSETLAECDQTSCRSVKEGYQMIYNQYLQGNLSLIITDADFSKRGYYTCDCGNKDLCDVRLQIETLNSTVLIKPGDPLFLEMDVTDPVKVYYNNSDGVGLSRTPVCTVNELRCNNNYSQRVVSAVQLKEIKTSDSGVYTIRDSSNEHAIHVYTVSVQDNPQPHPHTDPDKGAAVSGWAWLSVGVNGLLVLVLIGLVVMMSVRRSNTTECFLMNKLPARGEEEESLSHDP